MSADDGMRWLPLESNPEVMNKYIENLGASKDWGFHDIYGLDDELLMMVPRPVIAVMLLYPITANSEATKIGEQHDVPSGMYFMKQTVGNACGTVGIVHALANNRDKIHLSDSKALSKFLNNTSSMDVAERADALGKDESIGKAGWSLSRKVSRIQGKTSLSAAHESSALEGQTEAPDINAKTNLHFVAFVHCQGGLYELDGRREKPVRHSDTTPDTLLEDSVKVVKKFMERDPSEMNFTLTALALN